MGPDVARRRAGAPTAEPGAGPRRRAGVALLIGVIVGAIVADDPWSILRRFAAPDGPPGYPPGALTISAAAIATASPHVSRPFRMFGRWLIGLQLLGSLFLGATTATGGIAAIAVGLLAAAAVHMVVGSPGGRPTTARIRLALEGLGLDVDELHPASMRREGTFQFDGADAGGAAGREGLRPGRLGRPAAGQPLAPGVVPGHPADGPAEPARAGRARGVHHAARRPGRRPGPPPRHGGQRRRGDALVVVRPDGVPLRGWLEVARRPPRRSTPAPSPACGPSSTACTTPGSPTGASTSTASSSATTGRSASATCRRRP